MNASIIKSLQVQEAKLRKIIDHRNDYVLARSDTWQESEKCDDYELDTCTMENAVDELSYSIDTLQELAL